MITLAPSLKAIGGARTGIAPVNLLDVQDVNGNLYFWADRRIIAPTANTGVVPATLTPPIAVPAGQYVAWAPNQISQSAEISATLIVTLTGPFTPEISCTLSGFQMPALPAGAVIESVQVVINARGDCPCWSSINNKLTANGRNSYSIDAEEIEATIVTFTAQSTLSPASGDGINGSIFVGRVYYVNTITVAIAVYYSVTDSVLSLPTSSSGTLIAQYQPWLLEIPGFTFHRSQITDTGSFVLQNLSGDTLSRDFERIMRRSALEGAFFVYRCWQADAQAAWLEVHGTLTVADVGVDTVTLKGSPTVNPSQLDTPLEIYCETCQLQWGGKRCGAPNGPGTTECNYSFQTCQVVERIMIAANTFEKNYGESMATLAQNVINRRRTI